MRGMNNLQANLCLLAVTFCWSCEVVIFSIIPDGVNPFATTCVTSLIGAALLFACFARRIVAAFRRDRWLLVRRIVLLGMMNTAYSVLFLVGLNYFDVSAGAFTVSITAVVLPVMLLVMRRGVGLRTWISAGCVLAGIVVAMGPSFGGNQWEGLAAMGIGCLIRAFYIVKLNDWAREHDPITLAAGISGANAVIAFFPWLAMQPTTFAALPWSGELVAAYFIYGYFVIAFTMSLNTLAQRRATPAQATIIYSTEIVFSTIWATCLPSFIVDPVELTAPIVVGCVLIVVGNLVEIVPVGPGKEEIADGPDDAPDPIAAEAGEPAHTDDSVTATLARVRSPFARKAALFAVLVVVYLVMAVPFKVLEIIPDFADVRPVAMLMPVYGIFFGIPGCLASAVGNLVVDVISGDLRWSSIAGFVGNFAYPYLMYLFFTKLRRKPFNLRSGRAVGLFAVAAVICACTKSLVIAPAVAGLYPDVDAWLLATAIVCNDSLFPIGFAMPFIIMLQEEFGFSPAGPNVSPP